MTVLAYIVEKFGRGTKLAAEYDAATDTYTPKVTPGFDESQCLRAYANATAGGNTQVVAAQGAGASIRVLAVAVLTSADVAVKFRSATTDISSSKEIAAKGGFVLPLNPQGWYQTAANEALNINLSGAANVGVDITWVPITGS